MTDCVYVIYVDVSEEHVPKFLAWHDEVHIPDMLKMGWVVSAQRFELRGPGQAIKMRNGELTAPRYLVLYFTNTTDHERIKASIGEARDKWVASGRMFTHMTPAENVLYEAITPLLRPGRPV